ncbi:DUF2335 domain-containing protein [Photorhabdus sp. APURE]|uniref:DUF2335 domain-containing protein n=2 Tax=Photorhabdus TaxID=29487 RepID=UPI00223DBEF8|nr:DUF2335 domain-containing protein [Photorhabdus aballayi]MCW7548593.1 DUF2335 domain-containing protein [Photorhabdus aballayi]
MPNTNYFDFIPQKSDVNALADDLDKVHMDFAAVLKQFNDEIILSTGKETISEILTPHEQHTKGDADRFLTLIEQQQKHRHEMEKVTLEKMVRKSIRGQSYGLLLTFISLLVALILGLNGHNWLAAIIGSGTVTTILIIYVLNRNP